ncbi:MAG: DUF5719 family protein [Actinomycetota bacterium]
MRSISARSGTLSSRLWPLFIAAVLLCMAAAPAAALTTERPLPPGNPWAADRPDDNGGKIDLGWTDSPTAGIAAYRVYRAQQPGGPYALLSERSTDSTVNYLGYVDTGLTDGATYYYVVTAVDGQGLESGFSPELSAVPSSQTFQAAVTIQKKMVLSIAEQKLYCMENGRVVYIFLVSTGAGGTPTPIGDFRILYHDQAHPVPKYPGCVCYYWMGFYEDYAIHAWPTYNGVQSNYEGLGYPASHGCVRLDPTQAHLPFYWAPDGTPLSIIPGPFQAPPPPLRGGTVSKGTPEPSTTWYFAEGFTGASFDEYILIQNPNAAATIVDIEYVKPDGSSITKPYMVNANSRVTVSVDGVEGMGASDVSVRLTSGYPVVAERSMYFDYGGKTGGHDALGVSTPSLEWYFAEGYTGGGFDEYILIFNPESVDATVALDCLKPDGSITSQQLQVKANSRLTVGVDGLPGMDNTDVSVRVRSNSPVVAERSTYFGYMGTDGGDVSTGATQPAPDWYFAEGYTGGGFDEYILVLNPNDRETRVTLDFLKPDGSTTSQAIVVGANSRYTLSVDAVPGLESADVSTHVRSDLPVVAERAMYFGYPECPGGHVQTGYTEPGQLFYLAEGLTSRFCDTYVLVMNPGDTAVFAGVILVGPGGTLAEWPLDVAAHSRATVCVNKLPNLENKEFSIRVVSNGPVVVERAMYFSFPR